MTLSSLFERRLPVNRKEVYYTATVFPCIVCVDGFAHIDRLWKLLGIEGLLVDAAPETTNIQFLTEYNAKQSIYVDFDRARFPAEILTGETPDILILIDGPSPTIISIEAKMYDTVSSGDLRQQLCDQREKVLDLLVKGLPQVRVQQVALLPAGMGITAEDISPTKLLYWEHIVKEFADVPSASYFCAVLGLALKKYECLRNRKLVFHANMEAKMTGEDIIRRYCDGNLGFQTMGRSGGLAGKGMKADLVSDGWRRRLYELKMQEPPLANRNWFAIKDFAARVRQVNQRD